MSNHTKVVEIEEVKFPNHTKVNITPKKEHSELDQKKIIVKSKKISLSDKLSRSQIIQAKSIELYSSKENVISHPEANISPSKSESIKPIFNAKIPSKNKNIIEIKKKKDEYDHISLSELSDDENEEKPIIIKSKSSRKSHSINTKEVQSFKYCGKKRKNPVKGKERIKTDFQKKNNNNGVENKKKKKITNLNSPKIINLVDENNNDEKRRKNIEEKKILTNLVKKEGFIKILEYLSYIPLNRKNPIERELDDIILNLGLIRTTILLFQIQLEQCNAYNKTNNNKNINSEKSIPINNNMNISKNNHIKKNDSTTNSENDENIVKIHITDDEVEEEKNPKIKKCDDNEKRIRSAPKSYNNKDIKISNNKDINNIPKKKNNTSNSRMVSIKKEALNKELEINVHLQKDKDGKIFKYSKHHLCSNKGNAFYVFYCSDSRCRAKACYYVKSMKFENITNHKLPHSEHCYIRNMNRNMNNEGKYNPIVEEFTKRNYHEAQIFLKSDGAQLVKWYD